MVWIIAIPLIFSGAFLLSACDATDGCGIVQHGVRAAGFTMVAVGALAVLS